MKEYKGKKIEPREIENLTLDNSPHYFHEGKYIGFCNSDGLPHGSGFVSLGQCLRKLSC